MNLSVVKSMQVIREAAKSALGADVAPLVAAAVEVAHAYEEALSQQSVVSIGSGPLIDADAIAAKVVERLAVVGASIVKRPLPDGVPPVPWGVTASGMATDWVGRCVLDDEDIGPDLSPIERHNTLCAIVEAVNAYFGGVRQPPSPAEAATDNCETQLPDTAGYPVPGEIPPSAA